MFDAIGIVSVVCMDGVFGVISVVNVNGMFGVVLCFGVVDDV